MLAFLTTQAKRVPEILMCVSLRDCQSTAWKQEEYARAHFAANGVPPP